MFRASAASLEEPTVLLVQQRICILWKPPGWSVSVESNGQIGQTRRNRWGQGSGKPLQAWLLQEWGVECPITHDAKVSHGLVHRLDRETSGPLVWAHTYSGYYSARLQFEAMRVRKDYVCLCAGSVRAEPHLLKDPLLEIKRDGFVRSVVSPQGRPSCTEVRAVAHLRHPDGSQISLVEVTLHTGRLHQIRVHLSNAGHQLVGDRMYGEGDVAWWRGRLFLHTYRLSLDIGDGPIDVKVPLPKDLRLALCDLEPVDDSSTEMLKQWKY